MSFIQTTSFQLAVYQKGNLQANHLALVLPGKLDTKDYAHMRAHVDFLAEQGYLALSFDPPGTWESSGEIADYTMSNYLLAIRELIEHFENRPAFVMGHSRGGSMAMLAGIEIPEVTKFASIMSLYRSSSITEQELSIWQKTGFYESKRDGASHQ